MSLIHGAPMALSTRDRHRDGGTERWPETRSKARVQKSTAVPHQASRDPSWPASPACSQPWTRDQHRLHSCPSLGFRICARQLCRSGPRPRPARAAPSMQSEKRLSDFGEETRGTLRNSSSRHLRGQAQRQGPGSRGSQASQAQEGSPAPPRPFLLRSGKETRMPGPSQEATPRLHPLPSYSWGPGEP